LEQVKATTVFAEEEVEYNLRRLMNVVQETLAMVAFEDQSPRMLLWNTPFYDTKVFSNITFTLFMRWYHESLLGNLLMLIYFA